MPTITNFLFLLSALHTPFGQSVAGAPKGSLYPYGAIENTCGPTDQPMLMLTLTSVPPRNHQSLPTPYISVALDVAPVIPKPLTFPAPRKLLDAVHCAASCDAITSGTIVIERFDQKGASGHYDLTFKDGSEAVGTFQVKWRHEGKVICG